MKKAATLFEAAGLAEHLRADVHLADIVERGAQPERLELWLVPAEPDGNRLRVRRDPCGVRAQCGIADVHRGRVGGESSHGISGSRPATGTLPVDFHRRCESPCPASPRPASSGSP